MTAAWAAALASASVVVLFGVPSPGALRVHAVLRPEGQRMRSRPAAPARARTALPAALLVCAAAAVAVAVPRVLVPLLLAAAGTGAVARLRRSRARAAARRDERSRAVEACAALAGELRAGRAPADALDAAAELGGGPFAAALRTAARAVRLGGDPAPSLRATPDCAVPEVLRALAACWSVCAGSGAGLAAAVERLEEGLRAEQAQRRAVDAELAGPRATAGLLAVLPAGGLLLAAGLGADPFTVLLATPVGLLCLTVGLGLDALGLWWTGRLVTAAGGRP